MKNTTMKTLINYLTSHDIPELSEVRAELLAQEARNAEKANANRELYASAHDAVLEVIEDTPITVSEIYEACEANLPEGFTKAKVQYALLHYWNDEVVKIDNGKNPKTYRKA